MRAWTAVFAIFVTLTPLLSGANKLTEQDRIELVRGLLAEYATVKQLLPRAKKALPFESTGSFDKKVWEAASREYGRAVFQEGFALRIDGILRQEGVGSSLPGIRPGRACRRPRAYHQGVHRVRQAGAADQRRI